MDINFCIGSVSRVIVSFVLMNSLFLLEIPFVCLHGSFLWSSNPIQSKRYLISTPFPCSYKVGSSAWNTFIFWFISKHLLCIVHWTNVINCKSCLNGWNIFFFFWGGGGRYWKHLFCLVQSVHFLWGWFKKKKNRSVIYVTLYIPVCNLFRWYKLSLSCFMQYATKLVKCQNVKWHSVQADVSERAWPLFNYRAIPFWVISSRMFL